MDLIIFFAAFIILMGIGAPIYLSLIIPSILYIFLNPGLPMLIMSQKNAGEHEQFSFNGSSIFYPRRSIDEYKQCDRQDFWIR